MPITVGTDVKEVDDATFKHLVYSTMGHVFDVQRDLGPLMDERIYKRELAFRVPDAQRAIPVEVQFERFSKTYYLDLLVAGAALFEVKAVEVLHARHRGQLLQNLFFTGLRHGKLVNMQSDRVQHEFVNATATRGDRTGFTVKEEGWEEADGSDLKGRMTALLRDWGAGLDVALYEEAAAFLCGHDVEDEVDIRSGDRLLGRQPMHMAGGRVALRVTALSPQRHADFALHLRRLLAHASLDAVQWINVTRPEVCFRTIRED
jgi:GxxExxY protein